MSADDPSNRMAWEPDPDTAIHLVWIGAALMLLLAIVSAVGELLGWWNFIGEVGTTVGSLGSLLLAAYGLIASAGRRQLTDVDGHVQEVHKAVVQNGVKLTKLDKLDRLDRIQWALDEQTGVLTQIRDRL